jgi:hypothetical protein
MLSTLRKKIKKIKKKKKTILGHGNPFLCCNLCLINFCAKYLNGWVVYGSSYEAVFRGSSGGYIWIWFLTMCPLRKHVKSFGTPQGEVDDKAGIKWFFIIEFFEVFLKKNHHLRSTIIRFYLGVFFCSKTKKFNASAIISWVFSTLGWWIVSYWPYTTQIGTWRSMAIVSGHPKGHVTHKPRTVTMKLWEPTRKYSKAVTTHLQNHVV